MMHEMIDLTADEDEAMADSLAESERLELELALAMSTYEHEARERAEKREAQRVRDERRRFEHDRMLAASLADEPDETTWTCSRCLLDNPLCEGRCGACRADREAPFAASSTGSSSRRSKCGLPGCDKEALRGFCCEEHGRRARARGLCAPATDDVERCFVGYTGDFTASLLTRANPKRREIIDHFRRAWKKGPPPTVKHLYQIVASPRLRDRFDRYAAAVGNSRLRYHGTSCACAFGSDLAAAPCDGDGCALCSILKSGFRVDRAGTGPNVAIRDLRYGRGVYLSATSGKSNDYATRTERLRKWKGGLRERWRAMLVCSVACGRAFKTTEAQLHLPNDKPPPGFDSVVGQVGANLNYDEVVVYSDAAVIPEFLVVYALPDDDDDDD
mmetsp:Transcript_21652/g.69728  ORF Transcript_21652/g.69728 Transcript_21652/m.69728 type:complete len:387 (+) Transcript_21652:45-1205(+)